jgi:hypothetical protein
VANRDLASSILLLAIAAAAQPGCSGNAERQSRPSPSIGESDEVLAYREVATYPAYVPAVDVHHEPTLGKEWEFDPRQFYAVYHRKGWEDCLLLFGDEGIDVETQEVVGSWVHLSGEVGKYTFLGFQDGFDDCKMRIAELRHDHPEEELRRIALEAFDKMNPPEAGDRPNRKRRAPQVTTREMRSSAAPAPGE